MWYLKYMKTLDKSVTELNKFLYDFYIYNEVSKTSLFNFLTSYVEFILLYNNIQPEKYNIHLHFIKYFEDCITDIAYKKRSKRKKLRNKENAKKQNHRTYAQTLAYVQIGKNLKDFNIYLNLNSCNIIDYTSIATTLSHLGHEVEHIIQQFVMSDKSKYNCKCYEEKIKTYKSLIKTATSKSFVRRLTKKLHAHADNFALINSIETMADNNSVVYYTEFLKLLQQKTNIEKSYYYFLYDIYIFIELIQKNREKNYKIAAKRERVIKKSLERDFNIDEHILEIP